MKHLADGSVSIFLDKNYSGGYNDGERAWDNFVGFGDTTDFARIIFDVPEKMSFGVTATGASKFTVWSLTVKGTDGGTGKTLYTMKALKTVTLKK